MDVHKMKMEINMLMTEEQNLKKCIKELEKELLRKSDASRFITTLDKRTDIPPTENIVRLKKWLKHSERINKVQFSKEEIASSDDGSTVCDADAVIGLINFHITLKIQEEKEQMVIHSLKVKIDNTFQEKELKYWINRCSREKDFQLLIDGIISYAEWFENREDIANWLKAECDSHYTVEKLEEDGSYYIVAKSKTSNTGLFTCTWSIVWNRQNSSMMPSFVFKVNRKSQFFEESEYLFKKLSTHEIKPQETVEYWRRISLSVITTRDSDLSSSDSDNLDISSIFK